MRRQGLKALYLAFVMVFFGGSVPVGADPVIYSQPSTFPAGIATGGGGVFSTSPDSTTFDNFTLVNTSIVTDLHWQGQYFLGDPGTISAFTVTFWTDNLGQPGSTLLTETFLGSANETFIGNDNDLVPTFSYAVDLTTPFQANGGIQYWLSIVADVETSPPFWIWHRGTGGDGAAFIDFFGERSPLLGDLAVDLTGTASIPEPGSLSLISLGIVGVIAHRWRRRHTD